MKAINCVHSAIAAAFLLSASAVQAQQGRVFLRDTCPISKDAAQAKEAGPLAAAFLGKLAGAVTGAAIDSLAAALSEEKQVTVTATERKSNWYIPAPEGKFKISPMHVCLIFVVSEAFETENAVIPAETLAANWSASAARDPVADKAAFETIQEGATALSKLGIVAPPDFYFEARFVILDSGASVFALAPRFIYYPRFLGENVLLGPETRDVLLKVEFIQPGSDSPFAETQLQFNQIRPGKLQTKSLTGVRLPWSLQPPTSSSGTDADKLVPFNIKAMFTETAKPGRLGKILAGVIKDQKGAIVAAAETKAKLAVSESERHAARNAAAEAASTALTAYLAAYDGRETANSNLAAAKAATPPNAAGVAKAENAKTLAEAKLRNAEALARNAFHAADIPFTPVGP